MRALALLLGLVAGNAWAETLYLRSSSVCPNNGDGTAYACASSPGAVGAWNSSANANVVWGAGAAKVSAGDTLYVCGDVTNFMIIPSISGTAGNRWVISGACPGDPGFLQGGPSNNFGIDIEQNKSYYTIEDLRLGWAKRDSLYMGVVDVGGADATDITIQRIEADGTNANSTTNVCHTIYLSKSVGGLYVANNFLMQDIKVIGTSQSCASDNNDGVNLEALGTGAIVRRLDVAGSHEGLDVSGGIGARFSDIYAHDNYYAGIKFHGIMGCQIGTVMNGVISANNAYHGIVWQDIEGGTLSNATIQHAGVFHGLDIQSVNTWGGTCVPEGNTYVNNYISADYVAGAARIYDVTRADFEANNTWNGNVLNQVGARTNLIYFTDDAANSITISNFETNWQANHARDKKQTDPGFIGGATPDSAAGFCLESDSPLIGAGVNLGQQILGYAGEDMLNTLSIGARGPCRSRAPAATRPAL